MTHDDRVPVACINADLILEQTDFDHFAELSGDHNPIHVDPTYAAGTRFGATVAHGMLLFSQVRSLIAGSFPGASLESQELMFPAPTFAGEELDVRLDIMAPMEGDRLELKTHILRANDEVCLTGRCWLKLNREEQP